MPKQKYSVLGYKVDSYTFNELSNYVRNLLQENKNAHIVTINPEMIALAQKDNNFSNVIKNADIVIPDGIGVKLALKINNISVEQIPGIEFAKKLLEICNKNNYSVGFLGAKENVLQTAINNIKKEYPNLSIAFQKNGYFSQEEEIDIVEKASATSIRVLFVALGAPKQEFFIAKYKEKFPNTIMIGVGGSFDVWAGVVKRAPLIFRKCGCEWLYRTISQPSRFKRIFPTLPLFLFKVIIEKCKH